MSERISLKAHRGQGKGCSAVRVQRSSTLDLAFSGNIASLVKLNYSCAESSFGPKLVKLKDKSPKSFLKISLHVRI